jgi:hypothetical protein
MAGVNIADGHHLAMTKSVYVQNTHILDDRHTVHYCSGQKTYIFFGPNPCVCQHLRWQIIRAQLTEEVCQVCDWRTFISELSIHPQ